MGSWEDLERRDRPSPTADEFAETAARVFTSGDGKRFMELLRAKIIEGVVPRGADNQSLWELEGQRRLVRQIEGAISQGISALSRKSD